MDTSIINLENLKNYFVSLADTKAIPFGNKLKKVYNKIGYKSFILNLRKRGTSTYGKPSYFHC